MPYFYYKAYPKVQSQGAYIRQTWLRRMGRILPNVFIVVGATAMTTVLYPLLSYQMVNVKWAQRSLAKPVPQEEWDVMRGIAQNTKQTLPSDPAQPVMAHQETQPVVVDLDYTKVSNWFPQADITSGQASLPSTVKSYTLSIPKLDIDTMDVVIGGDSLDEHLIHYSGTALPGQYGNPVIFGHSVLPVFYNPQNYMTIFSKIPSLEKGDEIFVKYDGVEYKYLVESYHEIEPSQVEVLEQRYDRQTLTLITCVPPGTYLRRGVVMAVLSKY